MSKFNKIGIKLKKLKKFTPKFLDFNLYLKVERMLQMYQPYSDALYIILKSN